MAKILAKNVFGQKFAKCAKKFGHKSLAKKFWPGPLTLILKKKKNSNIRPELSNQKNYVGCRIPSHFIAQELLQSLDFPIAAPSANISTKLSSTKVNHLSKKLKNEIFVLNGGKSFYGLESTVINVRDKYPKILRLGSITQEQIYEILFHLFQVG